MSSRTCPDWPMLMEVAPELQFMHYTVAEAKLPADVLAELVDVPLQAVAICADLDHNVFNAAHTEPKVAEALRNTHWYELREGATRGPGQAAQRHAAEVTHSSRSRHTPVTISAIGSAVGRRLGVP